MFRANKSLEVSKQNSCEFKLIFLTPDKISGSNSSSISSNRNGQLTLNFASPDLVSIIVSIGSKKVSRRLSKVSNKLYKSLLKKIICF